MINLELCKRHNIFRKKEAYMLTQTYTCFECGKQGHMKADCPKLAKKSGHTGRKGTKSKKAYVGWDDNEVISSSNSESNERDNLALLISNHSDDEEDEVSKEKLSYDNDVQGAIDELLNKCKILYKTMST